MSGFDPKAYLAEPDEQIQGQGFDPKAYLAEGNHGMNVYDTAGAGKALLEHAQNAVSFGYMPQLQGTIQKFAPNPSADMDAKLKAQGFNISEPDYNSYLDTRDEAIKRLADESAAHPVVSGLGTVGGTLLGGMGAGAALKGLGVGAKAAQLTQAARAAKAAGNTAEATQLARAALAASVKGGIATGATMGAALNPGDTEGEINPLQFDERVRNAKIGGLIGGAAPLAAKGLEAGAGNLGEYLDNKAALKAARALGRPTPTQATQMANSGQDAQIGRTLLDEGAIPVLGTPGRIATRVDELKDSIGHKINDLIKSAGDAKTIDAEKLGMQILDSPELAAMRKTPGMEGTVSAIEKQVETLAKNGTMTLEEAQALRQGIDKSINFNKSAPDMRGAQEGLYQQRTAIRDAMNDSINTINPGAGKDALLNANRNYSNLSKASDILEREMGRNQANRSVSLTDTIAGAAGLAHGGPVGAAVLGGINKFGRTFGNSIQARGYDAIAKGLPSVANAAGSMGKNPFLAQRVAQSIATPPENQSAPEQPMDQKSLGIFRQNPGLIDQLADPALQKSIRKQINRMPADGAQPAASVPKGEMKWAAQGAGNLGLDSDTQAKLMADPKARQLLIQASDLPPGSRALQNIKAQIQKGYGVK